MYRGGSIVSNRTSSRSSTICLALIVSPAGFTRARGGHRFVVVSWFSQRYLPCFFVLVFVDALRTVIVIQEASVVVCAVCLPIAIGMAAVPKLLLLLFR